MDLKPFPIKSANMKPFVVLCFLVHFAVEGKVLPDIISSHLCRKSEENFEECALKNFEKNLPNLVKGIPEFGLPAVDPLEIPYFSVNRTLNDLVTINSVLKNVVATGLGKIVVEGFKVNLKTLNAETRINMPFSTLDMDYDVSGQLLAVPLRSKGLFKGNFTNTKMYIKGNLKTVDQNGVKYFKLDKLFMKIRVGDGKVKLTAANPDMQFAADLIADFYNSNPRLVMDAINPIFVDSTTELYRKVIEEMLAKAPAKEWLPE